MKRLSVTVLLFVVTSVCLLLSLEMMGRKHTTVALTTKTATTPTHTPSFNASNFSMLTFTTAATVSSDPVLATRPTPGTNTSDATSKTCVVEENPCSDNKTLPELIFVAGIEGSGHNLMKVLFSFRDSGVIVTTVNGTRKLSFPDPSKAAAKPSSSKSDAKTLSVRPTTSFGIIKNFMPEVHLMDRHGLPNASYMGFAIIHDSFFRLRMKPILDGLIEAKRHGKRGLLVYAHSFPMALGGILSTGRPDLIMLKHFDCILYRLKILVVKRHPLPAVMSTVRRFGKARYALIDRKSYTEDLLKSIPQEDYPYIMQARISEDQLIYLDQQLRQFGCHQVYFVNINDVYSVNRRWTTLKSLALFLQLTDEETKALQKIKLHSPVTRMALPPNCTHCTSRVLYDFFEERKVMWPLMAV